MNLTTLAFASMALTATVLVAAAPTPASVSTAGTPVPEPEGYEAFSKAVTHPFNWLTLGSDLRVRNEYYNTATSLTSGNPLSEQDVLRIRMRLWGSATVVTNLTVAARLSAEPREWLDRAYTGTQAGHTGMEWRYGILDQATVKWDNIMGQPLIVTAGRQDILLGDVGDWWLVADGTPRDGSWTLFLDSVRLAYEAKEVQTRLDLIYINQLADPGGRVPTIGNSDAYSLTEQNEQGVVVYLSNKSIEKTEVDAYFIYKQDEIVNLKSGFNGETYTVGGKVTGSPFDHWSYSAEGAYQFGERGDRLFASRDVSAYGAKAKLSYAFNDSLKNKISLVAECLSGDNPNTKGQDEMFDVLWGRYPRWSELSAFYYSPETLGRPAQMNNLGRVGPMWCIAPMKGMTASLTYNALFALQETPTLAVDPTLFSNDGNFRGHYLQAFLKYQFNQHIAGHVWGERLWEGNYYAQQDVMTFVRAEVMFTF